MIRATSLTFPQRKSYGRYRFHATGAGYQLGVGEEKKQGLDMVGKDLCSTREDRALADESIGDCLD